MSDQAEKLREIVKNQGTMKTRIITIASGKGGVGKTNLSINMAIAYAKLGLKVLVLDADLGLANVNVVMGVMPKYNLFHVIRKQKTMKDIIWDTKYGVKIVAGASGFSRIANLSEEERQNFVSELTALEEAEIIIIDTSAGISPNVLAFIEAADDVVIVTTPEPTAITDAYGIIKIIATEIDDLDVNLKLVVNRVSSVIEAKKVAQRVINITGQFLNIKVDYLGFVYNDQSVPNAVMKRQPFTVTDPKGQASQCMQHIVGRLQKVEYNEGGGISRFLKKLFGRLDS